MALGIPTSITRSSFSILPCFHYLVAAAARAEDFLITCHTLSLYQIAFLDHYPNLELDIILAASDTDVIKTYVRLGLGAGIIAGMGYDAIVDQDLVARDLSSLIPRSNTKVAYLKHNYLPLYSQHFIDELIIAGKENGY